MNISFRGHRLWIYIVKRNTKTDGMGPFKLFSVFDSEDDIYSLRPATALPVKNVSLMRKTEENMIVKTSEKSKNPHHYH